MYNEGILRCDHVEYGATASESAMYHKPNGASVEITMRVLADGARLPTDYRRMQMTAKGLQLFLDKGWEALGENPFMEIAEAPGTLMRANPDTVLRPLPLD